MIIKFPIIANEAPVGAVAGGVATALPLAFLPGATSALGGVSYGAAYGALQPTIGNESRTENIVTGGLGGGIVPATIGASGVSGQMAFSANFLYRHNGTNWQRTGITFANW